MEDGLAVAELTESVMAVIGAHAGWSNAAERQFFLDHMHPPVVDRHAAGRRSIQDFIPLIAVRTKVIKSERTLMRVDVVDRLVDFLIHSDRKQGTDNLHQHLLHLIK